MTEPVRLAEDRTLSVPPGALVKTAYVPLENIRMACRDRMALGDVERAHNRQLQLGDHQAWPPPVGRWEAGTFVLTDGRHAFIAALMLGMPKLLVAWVATPEV